MRTQKRCTKSWIFSTSLGVWLTVSLAKHVPSLEYITAQPANKMRDLEVSQPWLYIILSLGCDAVFTGWHIEEGSIFFQRVRNFQPELLTRRRSSGTLLILPKLLNMEVTGSSETMINLYQKAVMEGGGFSETTANLYKKPSKLWRISIRNLKWKEEVPPKLQKISTRNLRNYGKFLPETWNWGKRFLRNYRKFLTEASETMENFYQKPEMEERGSSETTENF